MLGNREPDKEYELPLWEVNHSRRKLFDEERKDYIAYRLGFEMEPTAVDPDKVAYKHFSEDIYPQGNVTEMDYVKGRKVFLSMDFNRFPQTAILAQKQDNKYIVFDEVVTENALTTEQGQNVAKKLQDWGIKHVYLYGDNTSNQKSGRYGRTGRNDWEYIKEELQKANISFTSKLKKQNPKRKVRVDKVNQVIWHPRTNERRLLINERCKWTVKDYKEAIVGKDGIKIDSGRIGHISDACDYFIYAQEATSGLMYAL